MEWSHLVFVSDGMYATERSSLLAFVSDGVCTTEQSGLLVFVSDEVYAAEQSNSCDGFMGCSRCSVIVEQSGQPSCVGRNL